jgi:predicted P-loop ATPase
LHKPALASFIGTVNNDAGILSDRTGNRRFLITTVEQLDWGYTDLDVNQVWAEAQAAYLAGEPWQLTPDEAKRAAELNEGYYEIEDPIEGLLLEHFDVDPNSRAWTPTTMILQTLEANGLRGNTRGNSMALASALRALGVDKVRGNNSKGQRVWGYKGVRYTGTLPIP